MAKIWNGIIENALVVENPDQSLDQLLEAKGISVRRLSKTPDEDGLIEEINKHQIQVVFKRSKVQITRKIIESCPSLLAVQLCCIGDDSIDKPACAENGIMIFDDYGMFETTKEVVDNFLKNKIGHFISYPTGQGMFIKR